MSEKTTSTHEKFSERLRELERNAELLLRQAEQRGNGQLELVAKLFSELQVSLEELRIVEEELQQQNDELIISRQLVETERQRYQDLFEFAPDGYVVTDRFGMIQEANRAAAELIGVPQKALPGKPLFVFFAANDHATFYDLLQQLAQRQGALSWEAFLQRRDREKVPLIVNAAPIREPNGNICGIRWLLRDNTQQKKAEEKMHTLNSELEARVEQRTAELRRSNEQLQQFAYVASHDLQEPLRAVSTYVQILADRYRSRLDSQADEFIHYAVDGASRMQELIRDLLNYSRAQTKEQELTETNCEEVVARVLESLQLSIAESMAAVTVDSLPVVMGDRQQLQQVFQNLLINALKFCGPEPPQIHIAAQPKEQEWVFSVRDNGIGLDQGHAERIFVIFQRLHTRREYPGTGIGLAICKRIIERHGGRIWVESEPGKGATFYFTLPIK